MYANLSITDGSMECAAQARQPCIYKPGANAESRNVVGIVEIV
jgi:hypothetical protein